MKAFRLSTVLALCASVALTACGGAQSDTDESIDDIIGGTTASGKTLNAIGTVGMKNSAGTYEFFCSATLISKTEVLTAKHCAIVTDEYSALYGMKLVNLTQIYFAIGPNANKPLKVVEAVAADISPVKYGGFVGLGNDVAIYHLAEPVTDVKPIKVAPTALKGAVSASDTGDIGKPFAAVGYGSKDNYEDKTGILSGDRRTGRETLRALEGKSFELMLGSLDAFAESLMDIYGEQVILDNMDIVTDWYNTTTILKDSEAYTGNVAGDVQTCHGDSGGPLLGKNKSGEKQIVGVVSGGWFSTELSCDYGSFYATLGGARVQAMLAKSLTWTDPCQLGASGKITSKGICQGNTALRCSDKWEGDRRLANIDCAAIDQVCAVDSAGVAVCADPGSVAPAAVPATGTAPSIASVKRETSDIAHGFHTAFSKKLQAKKK